MRGGTIHQHATDVRQAPMSTSWTVGVCALLLLVACSPARNTRAEPEQSTPAPPMDGSTAHLVPGPAPLGVEPAALEHLVQRNLEPRVSLPESVLASRLRAWHGLSVGVRVARWARLFVDRGDATYCFGLKPGGYVAESLLVQDYRLDCVSLFYRCTELARSSSPRDAIVLALRTRFAGGDLGHVLHADGAVDYDDPAHLDYSLDIVQSGTWGREVTREVGEAALDSAGSSHEGRKPFPFIPTAKLRQDRLRDGDLLFFVLDEHSERGRKLRHDAGIVIGHQGICHVVDGTAYSIHAAAKALPGEYEGNRVVQVRLLTYLRRVEHFKGIIVTRLDEPNPPTGSQ